MRKQVDFVVRVLPLGNKDDSDTMSQVTASNFIRTNYLEKGYEVIYASVAQVSSAGIVNIAFFLAKYEEVLTGSGSK